jgi:hypothetical protein
MKVLYFDGSLGVSGDMILSALLNVGFPFSELKKLLSKLPLKGYQISEQEVAAQNKLWGTKLNFSFTQKDLPERSFTEIKEILEKSKLPSSIIKESVKIFQALAKVEAQIHRVPLSKVHFHELGGIDTIIEIVGTLRGISFLGIETCYASALNLGAGVVKCAHGVLPLPAPATIALAERYKIPVYSTGSSKELVTPTGIVLLAHLVSHFGEMPLMKVERVGCGIGSREGSLLRVFIGEVEGKLLEERLLVIECNIDDMNPQIYEYLIELLFKAGARDVFIEPIIMKKTRPAQKLSVLTTAEARGEILTYIFRETTTLGVREYPVRRYILKREEKEINTQYGKIKVKLSELNGQKKLTPEYEECKKIAQAKKVPLKEVIEEILKEARL